MVQASGDLQRHPIHLHRNSFELTNVNGKPTAGVLKDVVLVKGFWKVEVDVTPAMDGLTLSTAISNSIWTTDLSYCSMWCKRHFRTFEIQIPKTEKSAERARFAGELCRREW